MESRASPTEPVYLKSSFPGFSDGAAATPSGLPAIAGPPPGLDLVSPVRAAHKAATNSTASSEQNDNGEAWCAAQAAEAGDESASASLRAWCDDSYAHGMAGDWNGHGWAPPLPIDAHAHAMGMYSGYGPPWGYPPPYGWPSMYMGGGMPPMGGFDYYAPVESTAEMVDDIPPHAGMPPPPPATAPMLSANTRYAHEAEFPAPPPGAPSIAALDTRPPPPEAPPGIPMVPAEPPPPPPAPPGPAAGVGVIGQGADLRAFAGIDREASCTSSLAVGSFDLLNPLADFDLSSGAAPGFELLRQPALARASSVPHEDSLSAMLPQPMLSRAKSSPAGPLPPQPPTMTQSRVKDGTVLRTGWTVDSRKLKVKDKVAVSPSFELDGVPGTFRMMLYPTAVSERKGGASFKKAKGKGSVHIKCESPLGEVYGGAVTLTILVCSPNEEDDDSEEEAARGPLKHNFAESGICSLPKDQEEWDFGKATDEDTQNFVVQLDILDPTTGGVE